MNKILRGLMSIMFALLAFVLLSVNAQPTAPKPPHRKSFRAQTLWPLHEAVQKRDTKAIRNLLAEGYCINEIDFDRAWTPLHWAVAHNAIKCVKIMLLNGAHVHAADSQGLTPLHVAACLGHLACCQLLIQKGADIAKKTDAGATPAMLAVKKKEQTVVEYLNSLA